MSEFIDTLSPPFEVKVYDDSTVLFRRMLGRHWAALTEQIRAERTAENDAEITADATAKEPPSYPDRALAREKVRDFIRRTTDIDSLVSYCRSDINGVARLLKFAAMECGTTAERWAEIVDTIPVTSQTRIADEIVFVPVPPKPAPSKKGGGGQSDSQEKPNSTGESASITAESPDAIPPT